MVLFITRAELMIDPPITVMNVDPKLIRYLTFIPRGL